MIRALLWLHYWSWTNRWRAQLGRLRKPRYLAAFIVGVAYFYWVFLHRFLASRSVLPAIAPPVYPQEFAFAMEPLGALLLLILVGLAWLVPSERAGLAFSEAEIAFLFPAPFSRRGLIHYKLLKSQVTILFGALLLTLFGSYQGAGLRALGGWLLLSTLNLHWLGASFAINRLMDWGMTAGKRRLFLVAAFILVLIVVLAGLLRRQPVLPAVDLADLDSWRVFTERLTTQGPMAWILLPFRWLIRPMLCQHWREFLPAAWPVFLLIIAHYCWVVRANVAFEEASLRMAEKRAAILASVQAGRNPMAGLPPRKRKPPFLLFPTGNPSVAILWKNLISAGRLFTPRFAFLLFCLVGTMTLSLGMAQSTQGWLPLLGFVAVAGSIWILLVGPQLFRQDLRQDLLMADVLKQYPLAGWQIVLGEILAPAAILATLEWLALGMVLLGSPGFPGVGSWPWSTRFCWAGGFALLLPILITMMLLIPNAAVMFLPSWFPLGARRSQGLEAIGQQLILLVGYMLALLVAVLPGAAVFALQWHCGRLIMDARLAGLSAAVAAGLVLLAEAALAVYAMGRAFERLDLSEEFLTA